jgi:hypothetical protein
VWSQTYVTFRQNHRLNVYIYKSRDKNEQLA